MEAFRQSLKKLPKRRSTRLLKNLQSKIRQGSKNKQLYRKFLSMMFQCNKIGSLAKKNKNLR